MGKPLQIRIFKTKLKTLLRKMYISYFFTCISFTCRRKKWKVKVKLPHLERKDINKTNQTYFYSRAFEWFCRVSNIFQRDTIKLSCRTNLFQSKLIKYYVFKNNYNKVKDTKYFKICILSEFSYKVEWISYNISH